MTKSSVAPDISARKQAFRIALARKGMTATQFADQNGVTKQAVSAVLSGKDQSRKLSRAIDRFIRQSERAEGHRRQEQTAA